MQVWFKYWNHFWWWGWPFWRVYDISRNVCLFALISMEHEMLGRFLSYLLRLRTRAVSTWLTSGSVLHEPSRKMTALNSSPWFVGYLKHTSETRNPAVDWNNRKKNSISQAKNCPFYIVLSWSSWRDTVCGVGGGGCPSKQCLCEHRFPAGGTSSNLTLHMTQYCFIASHLTWVPPALADPKEWGVSVQFLSFSCRKTKS